MKVHEYKTRIRYADTDMMGVVYYGNYFTFMEAARTSMLRAEGHPYKEIEANGILIPVSETKCKYLRPVGYEEEITVEVTVAIIKNSSFKFNYRIINEAGELAAKAYSTHPVVDAKWEIIRVPDFIREILEKYLEE